MRDNSNPREALTRGGKREEILRPPVAQKIRGSVSSSKCAMKIAKHAYEIYRHSVCSFPCVASPPTAVAGLCALFLVGANDLDCSCKFAPMVPIAGSGNGKR